MFAGMGKDQPSINDLKLQLARLVRWSPEDKQAIEAVRAELAAATLRKRIRDVVAKAPPLTDQQREALALLLGKDGTAQ